MTLSRLDNLEVPRGVISVSAHVQLQCIDHQCTCTNNAYIISSHAGLLVALAACLQHSTMK